MANEAAKYLVTLSPQERSLALDKMIMSGALPPTDNIPSADQIRQALSLGNINELKNALNISLVEIQKFEQEFKSTVKITPSSKTMLEPKNDIGL
jgi:hypothetical protein